MKYPPATDRPSCHYEPLFKAIHGLPDADCRTALCLSGGGIRSAAFNLGVLQALARRQFLDRFSCLSTVSGGGYGRWQLRGQVLLKGRMPMTQTWDRMWYETPNIHPCTIRDFFDLCAAEGYVVEQWLAVDEAGQRAPWRRSPWLANLFGEQALFLLRRAEVSV